MRYQLHGGMWVDFVPQLYSLVYKSVPPRWFESRRPEATYFSLTINMQSNRQLGLLSIGIVMIVKSSHTRNHEISQSIVSSPFLRAVPCGLHLLPPPPAPAPYPVLVPSTRVQAPVPVALRPVGWQGQCVQSRKGDSEGDEWGHGPPA